MQGGSGHVGLVAGWSILRNLALAILESRTEGRACYEGAAVSLILRCPSPDEACNDANVLVDELPI